MNRRRAANFDFFLSAQQLGCMIIPAIIAIVGVVALIIWLFL